MTDKAAQRVMITAGGSGIGRAIADCFLSQGAQVHICDVSEKFVAEANTAHPLLVATQADIATPSQVESWFTIAIRTMGGLDVLINNAGIGGPRAPLEDVSYEDWDRCIAVNVNGMFYCIKQATPMFKKQHSGCIINISSATARTGLPHRLVYATSKVAVLGLTHTVARELGPCGVRCNSILPGLIENERGHQIIKTIADERGQTAKEVEDSFLKYISMKTWIQPSEIGEVAVFLASDSARHISGQNFGVDGNVEWES